MNGADPRAQIPPTVASSAIQRGAEEILKLFYAQEQRLKASLRERDVANKVTVEVQTEDIADVDLRTQLKEALQKLHVFEAKIEQLTAELQSKEAIIERLSGESQELKRVIEDTLKVAPEKLDEDTVMSNADSTLDGELDQYIDEPTLVGDFSDADGPFLQPNDTSTPPLSSLGLFPGRDDDQLAFMPITSSGSPTSLQSIDFDFAHETLVGDSGESSAGSETELETGSKIKEINDTMEVEVEQQPPLAPQDSDSDTEYFPYPPGRTPPCRLKKPEHIFVAATPLSLPSFKIPASPLHPTEIDVELNLDEELNFGFDSDESDE